MHRWAWGLIALGMLAGCGPSPEQAGTLVALAGTATPVPSETATPPEVVQKTAKTPSSVPTVIITPSATPPANVAGRIVYTSTRGYNQSDIYLMNADGSGKVNLTDRVASNGLPDWSPDGSHLVFASNVFGNEQLFIISVDAPTKHHLVASFEFENNGPLLDLPPAAYYPAWSTDGSQLAFVASVSSSTNTIAVVNAEGQRFRPVTEEPGRYRMPPTAWSPDGKWIAYVSVLSDYSTAAINVIRPDGTGHRTLNTGTGDDLPTWSPDGKHILFVTKRSGNAEIYLMNVDGSNLTNLTNNPANDDSPAWSPDGKKILFTSDRGKQNSAAGCAINCGSEVFVMDADGQNQTRLTHSPQGSSTPAWSPDGQWIAYVCTSGDANSYWYNICLMKADGSSQFFLTSDTVGHFNPIWQPAPQAK